MKRLLDEDKMKNISVCGDSMYKGPVVGRNIAYLELLRSRMSIAERENLGTNEAGETETTLSRAMLTI